MASLTDDEPVVLRLSTGYEVPISGATRSWRGHLARALLGERLFPAARGETDRGEPGWHLDVVPEELRYILQTTDPTIKDALLYEVLIEDVVRLMNRVNKRVARDLDQTGGTQV